MRPLVLCAALSLSACGGPEIDFWQVTSSNVSFGDTCTDEPVFRMSIMPVMFTANSYLIYRIEKDGKTATVLDCNTLEASSCKNSDTGVTFTIAGKELFRSDTNTNLVMGSTCSLVDTNNWTLTDMGKTLSMEQDHVLSLKDDPMHVGDCKTLDDNYKANSPDKMGLDGCLVKYSLGFTKK